MIEIDRSGWRRVRFGDVVTNTKETVKDPVGAGLDRVVALEHMEPGSLQLSGWQDAADGTTFTRRFRVGQTLFAKRRAYQRKVAYAEFDGVCSGDILALEAKADELLPELLPFIVQSDAFFEHALRTSAGSLSPRTKWQDLATWEFELPSPDEQRRIADLLWSLELLRRASAVRRSSLAAAVAAYVDLLWQSGAERASLSSLGAEITYGTSCQLCAEQLDGFAPVLRIPNVVGDSIDLGDLKFLSQEQASESDRVRKGDLLVVRTNGNPDLVGRGAVFELEDDTHLYASYLLRVRLADSVLPEYLTALWSSRAMRKQMAPYIRSSAGNYNLSASNLATVEIPLLREVEQEQWLEGLRPMTAAITESIDEGQAATSLSRLLLRSILGGLE